MDTITKLKEIEAAPFDCGVREAHDIKVGQAIHQGDIYLHRVRKDHPRGKLLGTRKLAIGQGEGSHHMAEGDDVAVYEGQRLPPGVTEPEWMREGDLLGPVVVAERPWVNTHPVHAHTCLPAGVYQVTYQGDYRTQQRVID